MKSTKNKRRPWSAAEIVRLRDGSRKRTPVAVIADRIKRSDGATRQKAFSMGRSLDTRRPVRTATRKAA